MFSMGEKRMLILPEETVEAIDKNRGEMGRGEFIQFLIDAQVDGGEDAKVNNFATKEELLIVQQDLKQLLKSFLDFFVSYGLEIGKQSPLAEFEQLSNRLEGLQKGLETDKDKDRDKEKGKVTLKWK
jgi:hypothetical protein